MGYIASTKHLRMFCWVGDELAMIIPHLFADSDLGDVLNHSEAHQVVIMCFVVLLLGFVVWASAKGKAVFLIPLQRQKW